MTGEYRIKKADAEDAVRIAEIERECFSEPWSEKAVAEEAAADNALFYVCVDSADNVVGYVSGRDNSGGFYVNNTAVTASARRCGIGELLMTEIMNGAEKRGCEFITLEVRDGNFSARALYEKCGFAAAGRRKGFYRAPVEDAVLYTKVFKNTENIIQ